jgi:hypothetical protein
MKGLFYRSQITQNIVYGCFYFQRTPPALFQANWYYTCRRRFTLPPLKKQMHATRSALTVHFIPLVLVSVAWLCMPVRVLAQQPADTIKNYTLPEFIVQAQKDPEYEKRYQKLVRDVKKVYPYAKLAGFRLQLLEQNLQMLPSEKARKEYLKKTEKGVKDQFYAELSKLTVSQGKILIKLLHRETGRDTYSLIKEYRGNVTAWFWQGMAKFYTANLKTEYNPVEDWQIEQIIKSMGFE